jgi:hypothetical protein
MTSRLTDGSNPSRRRIYGSLLAGIVLLGLLLADFGTRNLYSAFRKAPHGRIYHPYYDHGYRPNFDWIDKYGDWRAPYFSNSLGLRDAAIRTVDASSEEPRILFIGDSFTEGVGIPWEETFVGMIGKVLEPEGIEVLNAGVMSYTPLLAKAKVRYLMEKEGLKFGRLVLLLDMSDIKDEQFYEEDAEGRARLIPYGPFASQAGWGVWVERYGEFSENVIEPNFTVIGALSRNAKIRLRKWSRKELGRQGAFTHLPDWILYWEKENAPNRAIAEAGITKLKQTLGSLQDYLHGRGVAMTLVIYPWLDYPLRKDGETRMQSIWREWAAEKRMPLIDLFPTFARCDPIRDWYIPGDSHWNSRGHALVADTLLQNRDKILPLRK